MIAQLIVSLVTILVVLHLILGSCAYLIFLERKVAAWTQDRIGPNRVNFSFGLDDIWSKLPIIGHVMKFRHFGLGQALIDGVKLFLKEDYTPPGVDKKLFLLAPAIVVIPAILGWAVIPWGGYYAFPGFTVPASIPFIGGHVVEATIVTVAAAQVNIGVIYILGIGSLAVYGVVVGGYASNNKYSFLGGLRATAQMLSYEIPMSLCVLIIILIMGTSRAEQIVQLQAGGGVWNLLYHPLLAIIFFTCVLAECNRAPFDLAEAEQELVGGYHTEYSSMKWALFFLGEYMHMITGSAFFCVLFLGGWSINPFGVGFDLPALAQGTPLAAIGLVLLKFLVFAAKVTFLLFVMMWVRWTLPRFRFDQLMRLAWRSLIPVTLAILLVTGFLVLAKGSSHWSPWWYLFANVMVLLGTMAISPLIPQGPPVNRKVGLEGSRFSPPTPAGK